MDGSAVFYALVIWGLHGAQPICTTGWDTVEQCEAAVGMSLSHGRKDLSWNCVPYPATGASIGPNTILHFHCGGFGGR